MYRYLHIHEFKHTPSLFSSCFSFSHLILFSLEIHFTSTLRPSSPVYFSFSSNSTSSFYSSSSISCKLIFFRSLFKVLHCLNSLRLLAFLSLFLHYLFFRLKYLGNNGTRFKMSRFSQGHDSLHRYLTQ